MNDTDYSDVTSTFGDRLVAARHGAGLKRKELAQHLGIKPATLRNWEDDRSEPRANRLTILSGMLGVSLVWLLTGNGKGPGDAAEADDGVTHRAEVAALVQDVANARATLTEANRRLAGLERRLARLAKG